MDHETIIRFLGYIYEFAMIMAAPAVLGAITWRISR
jgi:hypothetical protein